MLLVGEGALDEQVGANRWFVLLRDEQGYLLVPADGGDGTRFPDTDEGAEEAWSEFQQRSAVERRAHRAASIPRWLFGFVVAATIVWVIVGLITSLSWGSSGSLGNWWRWFQEADEFLYHVVLGSVAVLVSLLAYRWLSRPARG